MSPAISRPISSARYAGLLTIEYTASRLLDHCTLLCSDQTLYYSYGLASLDLFTQLNQYHVVRAMSFCLPGLQTNPQTLQAFTSGAAHTGGRRVLVSGRIIRTTALSLGPVNSAP